MEPRLFLSQLSHLLAAFAFGWLVLASYRWIRGRSKMVSTIVAITILARVAFGLALFWISYLNLPIVPSLHMGRGFWQIAPDATGYYQMAIGAADAGKLLPLDHAVPAPFFVNALALWMRAVGVSPASGMFLNLCLYVTLVLLVLSCFKPVDDWRRDLPCIVSVAAYSFSPVVLFHSTQPLKDELSNVLVALVCLGVLAARRVIHEPRGTWNPWALTAGMMAIGVATFGTAGIRWYNAIIFLATLLLLVTAFAVRTRPASLGRYLAGSCALLLSAWVGFWGGAGPYYELVGADVAVKRLEAIPFDLATIAEISRTGFLTSGGNTNIVVPLRDDATPGQTRAKELEADQRGTAAYQARLRRMRSHRLVSYSNIPSIGLLAPVSLQELPEPKILRTAQATAGIATVHTPVQPTPKDMSARPERPPAPPSELRAVPISIPDHLRTGAIGLAVVFVPLSVLAPLFGLNIAAGRLAMALTDIDTLFNVVTTLLVLALLWRGRHSIGDRLPFVVFVLILSAASAILLGYVVTNYGTLWRLRSSVVVPLWLAVVALSPEARECAAQLHKQESAAMSA